MVLRRRSKKPMKWVSFFMLRVPLARLIGSGVIAACFCALPAVAQTIVFNTLDRAFGQTATISSGRLTGHQFLVDGSDYILTSAILTMHAGSGSAPVLRVFAHDSNTGEPSATVLGTFTPPGSFSSTNANHTWTANIPVSANTPYWLMFSNDSGSAGWTYSFNTSATTPSDAGPWFTVNRADTFNSGESWIVSTASVMHLQITATATAIPEPATNAAIAGALGLAIAHYWRRRKASAQPHAVGGGTAE